MVSLQMFQRDDDHQQQKPTALLQMKRIPHFLNSPIIIILLLQSSRSHFLFTSLVQSLIQGKFVEEGHYDVNGWCTFQTISVNYYEVLNAPFALLLFPQTHVSIELL